MFESKDYVLPHEPDVSPELKALERKARFRSDFLSYTAAMFECRTGGQFHIANPINRISHHRIMVEKLLDVFFGRCKKLLINIPPRYTKTEFVVSFITWAWGRVPEANFIYTSYSKDIAMGPTGLVKTIMDMPAYKAIFDTRIDKKRKNAGDEFYTTKGGCLYTAGCRGAVLGKGAGRFVPEWEGDYPFGGAFIIDDPHNSEDVVYATKRESVLDWYHRTAKTRLNHPDKTPIIAIMQRLDEADISDMFKKSGDWEVISLPALLTAHDGIKYALDPAKHTVEQLEKMQKEEPYWFSAMFQQEPTLRGGALYKIEWFRAMMLEPTMLATFIVIDSAETDKTYNDATAMSFFGCYKQYYRGVDTGLIGLHWLNCWEEYVEPADLEQLVLDFYADCMRHPCKPIKWVIEEKSTGVTLASVFKNMPGIEVITLKPTVSKIQRLIDTQKFLATGRVTLPAYSRHNSLVLDHCEKITADEKKNKKDDIADTLAMAVKVALQDGIIVNIHGKKAGADGMTILTQQHQALMNARQVATANTMNQKRW